MFFLIDWIERRPEWLRPTLIGALFFATWSALKATLIVVLALGGLIVSGQNPGAALFAVAAAILLSAVGGALSGVAYSALGRSLIQRGGVGPALGGIVTMVPYTVFLLVLLRVSKRLSLWAPITGIELATAGLVAVLFGATIARAILVDLTPRARVSRPPGYWKRFQR